MTSKQKNIWRKHRNNQARAARRRAAGLALAKKPPVKRQKRRPVNPLQGHSRVLTPEMAAELKLKDANV